MMHTSATSATAIGMPTTIARYDNNGFWLAGFGVLARLPCSETKATHLSLLTTVSFNEKEA